MDPVTQLQELIRIKSFSGLENEAADWMQKQLLSCGIFSERLVNNVWAKSLHFDANKPTLLLNSHLDTVKVNSGWTFDPFAAEIVDGKIIGLGSNDAGGSLIALLNTFVHFYDKELNFNLIFCASAEEENSGINGMELVRNHLGKIDCAIVGEPTNMEIAIAEKGLLVIDAEVIGEAGHAARNSGKNAIYLAMKDIQALSEFQFPLISDVLGPVNINVTQIQAGSQHNVIPGSCLYTIDVRLNEFYTHQEALDLLQSICIGKLTARSMRLSPSGIPSDHVFNQVASELNIHRYGSPTMSDQALMPWPSIKMGPGFSERSHTADEYLLVSELEKSIKDYDLLLNTLNKLI